MSQAAFTILLIGAIFIVLVWYMQHTSKLDGMNFDVQTVTASDYTVEMDITSSMWEDFLANQFAAVRDEKDENGRAKWSQALYLKQYLHDRIGEILTEFAKNRARENAEHKDEHSQQEMRRMSKKEAEKMKNLESLEVDVFDIEFAYNNHDLIKLLKLRGSAITYLQFDKVKEYD